MIYDYIILGGGPGGVVAAKSLADKNHRVLLLEAGRKAPDQISSQETNRYSILHHYKNAGVNPIFGKRMFNLGEGVGLGGGALINGGLIWRTPDFILQEWDEKYLMERSYTRLNRYFEQIENILRVKKENEPAEGYDVDSVLMDRAAQKMNLKSVLVPKSVNGCQKNNQCPSLCPGNAKTYLSTYIDQILSKGGRILAEHSASRIRKQSDHWIVETDCGDFQTKKIVMSMGTTSTAHFLMKNGIIPSNQEINFQCHLNLKCIATFKEKIHASKGTMFTHQVQEYEREGIYLMPSNYSSPYLSTITAGFDSELRSEIEQTFDHHSIFIAQVRPKGIGRVRNVLGQRILTYELLEVDFEKMKKGLIYLCEVLFEAGAVHVYLPIGTGIKIHSMDGIRNLSLTDMKRFDVLSVHSMASLPMRNQRAGGLVDEQGRLIFQPDIHISDGSILPSNMGESPQGTIMAFAHSMFV